MGRVTSARTPSSANTSPSAVSPASARITASSLRREAPRPAAWPRSISSSVVASGPTTAMRSMERVREIACRNDDRGSRLTIVSTASAVLARSSGGQAAIASAMIRAFSSRFVYSLLTTSAAWSSRSRATVSAS